MNQQPEVSATPIPTSSSSSSTTSASSSTVPPKSYSANDIAAITKAQHKYQAHRSYTQYENLRGVNPRQVSRRNLLRLQNLLRQGDAGLMALRVSGNTVFPALKIEENSAYTSMEKVICGKLHESLMLKHVSPGKVYGRLLSSKELVRQKQSASRHTGTQSGDDDNVFFTCGIGRDHHSQYDTYLTDFDGESTVITVPLKDAIAHHKYLWISPHLTDFIKATGCNHVTLGDTKYSIHHDPIEMVKVYRYERASGDVFEYRVKFDDEIYQGKDVSAALIAQFILHLRLTGGSFAKEILHRVNWLSAQRYDNNGLFHDVLQAAMEVLMPSWISNEVKIPVFADLAAMKNVSVVNRPRQAAPESSLATHIYNAYMNCDTSTLAAADLVNDMAGLEGLNRIDEVARKILLSPLNATLATKNERVLAALLKQRRQDKRCGSITIGVNVAEDVAIQKAIDMGSLVAVKLLVEAGFNPCFRLQELLLRSASSKNPEIFNYFMTFYQTLNAERAKKIFKEPMNVMILMMLASRGNCAGIKALVTSGIVAVNATIRSCHIHIPSTDPDLPPVQVSFPENHTALHRAALMAQPVAIRLLVKLGGDINAVDGDGKRPRDYYSDGPTWTAAMQEADVPFYLDMPLLNRAPLKTVAGASANYAMRQVATQLSFFWHGATTGSAHTAPIQSTYSVICVVTGKLGGETAVLLGKRHKVEDSRVKDIMEGWWLPGGEKSPTDNNAEEAAVREAQEETGLPLQQLVADGMVVPKLLGNFMSSGEDSECNYSVQVYHLDVGERLQTLRVFSNDDLLNVTKVTIKQIKRSEDNVGRQQGHYKGELIVPSNMAMILQACGESPKATIESLLSDENDGFFKLRKAAKKGDLQEVQRLLQIGTSLHYTTKNGKRIYPSVFTAACAAGQLAVVQHLVTHLAAGRYWYHAGEDNPLTAAFSSDNKQVVEYLLNQHIAYNWFSLQCTLRDLKDATKINRFIQYLAEKPSVIDSSDIDTERNHSHLYVTAISYVAQYKLDPQLMPQLLVRLGDFPHFSSMDRIIDYLEPIYNANYHGLVGNLLQKYLCDQLVNLYGDERITKLRELMLLNADELLKLFETDEIKKYYLKGITPQFRACLELHTSQQVLKVTGAVPTISIIDDYEPQPVSGAGK